jgi:hypothetical protein
MNSKTVNGKSVLAGLALAGALAAAAAPAHAGGNVQWSVTIGAPLPHVVVRDTYYPYRPVVVAPRHVGNWDRDRDGIPNRYDREHTPRWDRDGDGVPNRYDRYPNGRSGYGHGYRGHDRDGDGVPNWRDRNDGRGYDRDGDGIPNRHDRHDRNPRRG